MAVNTNISNWINRSEYKVDFYTEFIKVWIPFNAWYMHNFYDEDSLPKRDRDSAIIHHINSTSNTYRDKIKALLRGTDTLSCHFKKVLGKLHNELESNPIPNFNDRISFHTISLTKNSNKSFTKDVGRLTYFVEFKHQLPKTQKRWLLEVQKKNNNQTLHRVELHNWSHEELNNDADFIALPENSMRINLRKCFDEINPNKVDCIVVEPKIRGGLRHLPNNSFVIDKDIHLYFIEDYDLVSKIIVQLIYELRCKLFHGEMNPNDANMKIYEFLYKLQKTLIQELK